MTHSSFDTFASFVSMMQSIFSWQYEESEDTYRRTSVFQDCNSLMLDQTSNSRLTDTFHTFRLCIPIVRLRVSHVKWGDCRSIQTSVIRFIISVLSVWCNVKCVESVKGRIWIRLWCLLIVLVSDESSIGIRLYLFLLLQFLLWDRLWS